MEKNTLFWLSKVNAKFLYGVAFLKNGVLKKTRNRAKNVKMIAQNHPVCANFGLLNPFFAFDALAKKVKNGQNQPSLIPECVPLVNFLTGEILNTICHLKGQSFVLVYKPNGANAMSRYEKAQRSPMNLEEFPESQRIRVLLASFIL